MCLGHDTRIAGGVLVVSVINGELKEVCSAKVRKLGERSGPGLAAPCAPTRLVSCCILLIARAMSSGTYMTLKSRLLSNV